ncbi:MAG TPA: hypothetical protein VLB90_11235 [Pseudomonadales bacterium]|nr:hypothetical protein [Pseudomonadales bacterium]
MAEGKFSEVSCVLAERLYFYLGTYETQTYKFTSVKNKLNSKFAENIGDLESQWWAADFEWRGDVALSPYGEKTVDQLTIKKSAPGGNGDIVQWIPLRGGKPHTFSVWLWSPVAKTVNLSIARHYNPVSVASKQITLSPEPTRYSVTGITPSDALYDVDIGLSTFAAGIPTTFGTEVGDTLYAWGAQLEVGDQMTGYDAKEVARPDSVRVWRPALVVLNVSMLMFVLIAIIRARTFWFQRRAGICILVIIFAAAAESLAIIPEQRFATGWMIFFWLIATTFIFMQAKESTKKHRIHS